MTSVGRALVDGHGLAYKVQGGGEPVLLIHWGVSAAWAAPLLAEPALAERFLLVTYDRIGFGHSGPVQGMVSMAEHAEHCRLLLRQLGIERAHVVGHSSSAAIGLQLALDSPKSVQSLALLEPARPAPATAAQENFVRDVVEPTILRYRAGDKEGAVDAWCVGVFGPGYRRPLDRAIPSAFERAVADADAFFTSELPALQRWSFTEDDAKRVLQPTLVMLGEKSIGTFSERRELLLSWLPAGESLDIAGTTHLLHMQSPRATASGLADFFARHPLGPGPRTMVLNPIDSQTFRHRPDTVGERSSHPPRGSLLERVAVTPSLRGDAISK
jgi:pimeloyl-ACP methyl ester carboxylesterase